MRYPTHLCGGLLALAIAIPSFDDDQRKAERERRVMNLNYGDLLIAHALIKNGGKMEDIAAQLKTKTSLGEIAKERHADWKQIAADAKKLNSKIGDNPY